MSASQTAAQNFRAIPKESLNANLHSKASLASFTEAERDALAGDDLFPRLILNTTTSKLNFYTGSAWEAVTSA